MNLVKLGSRSHDLLQAWIFLRIRKLTLAQQAELCALVVVWMLTKAGTCVNTSWTNKSAVIAAAVGTSVSFKAARLIRLNYSGNLTSSFSCKLENTPTRSTDEQFWPHASLPLLKQTFKSAGALLFFEQVYLGTNDIPKNLTSNVVPNVEKIKTATRSNGCTQRAEAH